MGLRAGSLLINPPVVLSSMPPIRVASTSSHPGSYLWNESSFNLHKHTKARDSNAPYPSAMDVHRRSGDASCNDSFEDLGNVFVKLMTQRLADKLILGLLDLISATKRVSRKKAPAPGAPHECRRGLWQGLQGYKNGSVEKQALVSPR